MELLTHELNAQRWSPYEIADYSGTTTNSKNKHHLNAVAYGSPDAHPTSGLYVT